MVSGCQCALPPSGSVEEVILQHVHDKDIVLNAREHPNYGRSLNGIKSGKFETHTTSRVLVIFLAAVALAAVVALAVAAAPAAAEVA